ncbi:uncharacterized protein J3R85_004641 [Psidium guajava]|nr:uncharacterized protein J3R85_004641 [Psidium guajava]
MGVLLALSKKRSASASKPRHFRYSAMLFVQNLHPNLLLFLMSLHVDARIAERKGYEMGPSTSAFIDGEVAGAHANFA